MITKKEIITQLRKIVNYNPYKRFKGGHAEIVYDEFAYRRIVESYKTEIKNILKRCK
jgi:hypothetical protein